MFENMSLSCVREEEGIRGVGEDEGTGIIMVPLTYMDIHQFSPLPAWKANTTVEVASLAARSAQLTPR